MPATDIVMPPRTMLEVYESLPEGTLIQLIQNKLIMSPSPFTDHQKVLLELAYQLKTFVKEQKRGDVFIAPYDVHLDSENVYQPDILFIAKENLHKIKENGFYGAPDLIIEILSPSTAIYDKIEKKEMYEHYGVREYWIIDPKTKSAEGFWLQEDQFKLIAPEERNGRIRLKLLDLEVKL